MTKARCSTQLSNCHFSTTCQVMTFVCGGCPWLLFVFHHWPIDSNKALPGVYGWYSSTLSKPPRVLHLWFWWTAQNQQTVEGSHVLNLRALCGGLSDEPWVGISHPGEGKALKTGPLNEPMKTHSRWCILEISLLESIGSWHNIAPAAIQTKIMFVVLSCEMEWNSFWQCSLFWQLFLTHFYLNTNVFWQHVHCTTCCIVRNI